MHVFAFSVASCVVIFYGVDVHVGCKYHMTLSLVLILLELCYI